ncbi:MAG: VWA domain-containing protein [Gordonia sp. (in: high G+C Gram-positive bacteria)]
MTEVKEIDLQKTAEDAKKRLPVYVVIDTSWSMSDDNKIQAAREILPTIRDSCLEEPLLKAKALFSIIEMNTKSQVLMALGSISTAPEIQLNPSGLTNYQEVFELLRTTIEHDYQTLKADGVTSHRPVVFFITDGEPQGDQPDGRRRAFESLTDKDWRRRPNIVMFGVGSDVSEDTLKQYAAGNGGGVLVAPSTAGVADHIRAGVGAFLGSVVSSLNAATSAGDTDGFVWRPEDYEDADGISIVDVDLD